MEERELRRLAQKRKLLWKRVAEIEEFLRGSVVLMKRRCIFAGCRKCASGERHPTWVLTLHRKGKTRTVYPEASEGAVGRRGEGRAGIGDLCEVRQADATPKRGVRAES